MSKEIIRPEQFGKADATRLLEGETLFLNDAQLQELSDLYEGATDIFKPGKLITGKIIKNDGDGVLVDISYKSYGLIPRFEFSQHELKKFKEGDNIEVILDTIEGLSGEVVLSYEKAKSLRAWDEIMKLFEEGKPVEGSVTHKVKGGLSVDIGIPAFLPGSQIDLQRVTDFDQYVGQMITANIIKVNKKRGNVIISRRKHLADQRTESRKKIIDTLSENQIIQGTVKNITNYGVFIDIGGVDGLLHITDMTWGRISHPSELVSIGDQITVKVLSFDKENEKISLGLKQLAENPWDKLSKDVKVGSHIKGTISSITDYGLFVEVEKGIEGLVHISEISWTDRITNLADKFKVGQEIEVLVVSLDKENRRMSLSIKQLSQNPWESIDERFKVGQKITGKISNITDFGIFVQLIPGIDGLVHISDMSWTEHVAHPSDLYTKGHEVEAVILNIDKDNKKVSLGIKQLTEDPWALVEQEYTVNKIIQGEVTKLTSFGAFVKLQNGIEGLVHSSELSAEEPLKVGETKEFRVINVNKEDRKIGLSTRLEAKPQAQVKETTAKASPKKEKVAAVTTSTSAAKPKGIFQMELERHAARQKDAHAPEQESTTDETQE